MYYGKSVDVLYRRSYRGPVRLAIFDYAGTTVDYGCIASAAVFVEGYRRKGIDISMAQAREPTGTEKANIGPGGRAFCDRRRLGSARGN